GKPSSHILNRDSTPGQSLMNDGRREMRRHISKAAAAAGILTAVCATAVGAKNWEDWGTPINVESLPGSSTAINTPSIDGCASTTPDGLTLLYNSFSNGNFDIFMATRSSTSEGFGEPVRLP